MKNPLNKAYLSAGTNLGDRLHHLARAVDLLERTNGIRLLRLSQVYSTRPWGFLDQPSFLNQIIEIETSLTPLELLQCIKSIESQIGRKPTFLYGPRIIDLDILFYGDETVQVEGLGIPHPHLAERAFVLVPLAELAPDFIHPQLSSSVKEMLGAVDRSGVELFHIPDERNRTAMGHKRFPLPWGVRTYIMGVLNITPDSFSGDGLMKNDQVVEAALQQAKRFVAAGADILDLGAESTRPGAQTVSDEQEQERLLPVLKALVAANLDVILCVDTYKSTVAEAAIQAGANWINDVWGLRADENLASVAARYHVPLVLMHNRSKPSNARLQERLGGRYVGVMYDNLMQNVKDELLESVGLAHRAGVGDRNIILDPGIGFGKTVEQNLELLNRLPELRALGFPLLVGTSRKSFIGYTLDLPPDQRLEGTAATVAISIVRGADIVRVHDVEFMVRVARMTDAVVRSNFLPE